MGASRRLVSNVQGGELHCETRFICEFPSHGLFRHDSTHHIIQGPTGLGQPSVLHHHARQRLLLAP